jgi:hypothetical protein
VFARLLAPRAFVHPALFAAGYVLLSYANLPTPISGLWRPLAVAMIAALLLSLLLAVLTRSRSLGALLATSVVLALSAAWVLAALAAVAVLWIAAVSVMRRARGATPLRWPGTDASNRMVGVFGAMFAAVALVSAAPPAISTLQFSIPGVEGDATDGTRPNIYLILMDGYPSTEVLQTHLSFGNSAFEGALVNAGFEIATESRSNYTATWATLASMFNGAYLDEIESLKAAPADQEGQYASLMRAINTGRALGELRGRGYRIVTVPSPFEGATLVSADEVLSGGQLTFFELSLLQHSPLLGLIMSVAPDFVLDQQASRTRDALETTARLAAEEHADPLFLFTHVLSPHPPIVFQGDGSLADLPACFPDRCTLWEMHDDSQWQAFAGQIRHINEIVTDAIERVVASDPEAVIVVMSDHGSQPPGAPETALLQNVIAVRSPAHEGLLASDAHPVDLLPVIWDAYFGTETPRHDYRGWINRAEHPLEMVEVSIP